MGRVGFNIRIPSSLRNVCMFSTMSAMSISKFKGCLLGSLLGDCLGSPYEADEKVSKIILQRYFDCFDNPNAKSLMKQYTDDTVMTKAVAEMLIKHKGFDATDLANRFVKNYYDEPRRGYGGNVISIFSQLKNNKFQDVWSPARNMFDGSGSWGNGGAMRISPVALFYHSSYSEMIEVASKVTEITHTNRLGINGALLQCIAVNMCLNLDPNVPLDGQKFLSELSSKLLDIESKHMNKKELEESENTYKVQLELVKKLLDKDPPTDFIEEIVNSLGHSVSALYSVPTAVYCFLRAQKPVDYIETTNPFRRVLQFSISLGGDTDTIASMAGALSGAYHGYEIIEPSLVKQCESPDKVIQLAESLYQTASVK